MTLEFRDLSEVLRTRGKISQPVFGEGCCVCEPSKGLGLRKKLLDSIGNGRNLTHMGEKVRWEDWLKRQLGGCYRVNERLVEANLLLNLTKRAEWVSLLKQALGLFDRAKQLPHINERIEGVTHSMSL